MGTMDSFDAKKDDWHTYEERLDIYFIANDIPESKKVAVMLSMIGAESYQLLRQLSTPTKPSDMSYGQIVEMLGQHLSPEPRVIPERFRFGKCKQFKKESLQDFVLRLKKQVQHCQYGDRLDEMLRDQFIAGLNLESAQKALLKENDDLTFACAVDITSAHEAAEKEINASKTSDEPKQEQQQQQQQQQKQRQQQQQQQQQKKKGQNRGGPNPQGKEKGESKRKPSDSTGGGDEAKSSGSIRCYRCGKNHHVKECWYPADIICGACKKKGHTEHVCRNKKN